METTRYKLDGDLYPARLQVRNCVITNFATGGGMSFPVGVNCGFVIRSGEGVTYQIIPNN